MSKTGWTPGMVPYGADETVYLVVDSLSNGTVYRETEFTGKPRSRKPTLKPSSAICFPANTTALSASLHSTRWNTGPKTYRQTSRPRYRCAAT
jgi:hypothetical protein